jgi:hypothetical protein
MACSATTPRPVAAARIHSCSIPRSIIIYNASMGFLCYDRDGTGTAAALQFAQLNGNPGPTNTNFLVVA